MSMEKVIKALVNLGLSRITSEVYVYLGKKGSQTILDLTKVFNYSQNEIKNSLNILEAKGLVTKINLEFFALSFEETLKILIEQEKQQTQSLQEMKARLVNRKNEE